MSYWQNKSVLVTGGAGFIGSNLCKDLVCEGAHVTIIDNFERGRKEYILEILDSIYMNSTIIIDKKVRFVLIISILIIAFTIALYKSETTINLVGYTIRWLAQ